MMLYFILLTMLFIVIGIVFLGVTVTFLEKLIWDLVFKREKDK
jgi:hypothetical protein